MALCQMSPNNIIVTILQASVDYVIRNLTLYKHFPPVNIDEFFYCVEQFSKAFKGNWLLINIYDNPTEWFEAECCHLYFLPCDDWCPEKSRSPNWTQLISGSKSNVLLCFWRWSFISNSKKTRSIILIFRLQNRITTLIFWSHVLLPSYVCIGARHRKSPTVSFESSHHLQSVLLPPFHRQGNRISEILQKLPKITHLANYRSRVQI